MSDGPTPAIAPSPGAVDRDLARGMLVVAVFACVSGAARVSQDAAIAWRYGTGPVVDAYYFTLNLVSWPAAVALSALTMLCVPVEAALRHSGEAGARHHFRRELLAVVLLGAALSAPLSWWALANIAGGPAGGLDRAAAAIAVAGVPQIVSAVPLGLLGALFAAWLVAAGRHVLTLLEALPPLVLMGALMLMPGPVLFWGTAAGVAVQTAAMVVVLMAARDLPRPRLGLASPAWRGFASGALALLAAQLLFTLLPLIDAFFAARLSEGTLAALNFANRLTLGLQGLAGLALQRVGLPLLSQLVAVSPSQARRAALRWSAAAGICGSLVGAVVALFADPIVSLLFERGRFTAGDREQVAMLLRWSMLQLPAFLAGLGLATALASAGARASLAVAGAVGLAVKIGSSAWLVGEHGAVGLQVATALMYTATALMAWTALNRRLGRRGP